MDTAQPKRIQRKRTKWGMMGETRKVIVKQAENEPEIPAEIIAQAIVRVSEATKKLNAAGLKEEAIVLLLHDHCRVGKPDIRLILRTLPELRRLYTTK